ncbi:hypothetical protein N9M78_03045 [Alphaproteobacteria bacterium]|nr:hypothetical protein [Alphaproteobacteria bacterium]
MKNFGAIPENTNFGIKSSVVRNLLDGNGVSYIAQNNQKLTKSELGRKIADGTFFISCWMTIAQIKAMKTKKVLFSDLD